MTYPRRRFLIKSITASVLGMFPFLSGQAMKKDPSFEDYQISQRKKLLSLLGDLPQPIARPPLLLRTECHQGFSLEYLEFYFNAEEPVRGILLLPDKINGKAPGLLYCHAHFGTYATGKDELLNGRTVMPPYAPVYAEKGIVTLAIDSWCFGERFHGNPQEEMDVSKKMLWEGKTLFGMMLWDEMRALDYLLSRKEVDSTRVGVFGLSLGATKAWWLSALDTRITTCMDLCCLTDFDELVKAKHLSGHGIYYYVPSLLKYFTTSTINELIVPRPHVSLNGSQDELTPPKGVEKVRDYLLPLYRKYGSERAIRIELFDCPHEELPEMRKIILDWLDQYLVLK